MTSKHIDVHLKLTRQQAEHLSHSMDYEYPNCGNYTPLFHPVVRDKVRAAIALALEESGDDG